MPIRWKLPLAIMLALAGFVAFVSTTASASTTYHLPANQPSPQYKEGPCLYKVWYGNYGSTAFAKIRIYNNCGTLPYVSVWDRRNGEFQSVLRGGPGGEWTPGSDGCGGYFERQATDIWWDAIATGVRVEIFTGTFPVEDFRYFTAPARTVYRYC